MTPRAMKLYKDIKKRRVSIDLTRIDVTKISEIVKAFESNQRNKRRRDRMKVLKEQARHFEPYVPKLTSSNQLSKQSSLSVLQSFTSSVLQLCSPEKSQPSPTASPVPTESAAPLEPSASIPLEPTPTSSAKEADQKKSAPKANGSSVNLKSLKKPQCIDLCSSSDDEVELKNHIQS